MGKLIRCITNDGAVMATAVDSTDIVARAEQIHKTSAVVTAALGRLLTASSMMGNMLKSKDNSITLKISGDGPIGSIITASDFEGNVRGYVQNPIVEIPLNSAGKLDVGSAVGRNGTLYVSKDLGLEMPYNGQVPIVSGEIAEDITAYYAMSEQVPTVCALGVLVNPDLTVKTAGGYIIQLLPGADDSTITQIENNIKNIDSVTQMLENGKTPEEILKVALQGFELEVLYEQNVAYKCDCSRERVERALISLGHSELLKLAENEEKTEVKCHFCDKVYNFTNEQIKKLAE